MRGRATVLLATLLVTVSGAALFPAAPVQDPAVDLAAGETVPVRLDGTTHRLTAQPHSILGEDVRPRVLPADETRPVPETDSYVGRVVGLPDATVRLVVEEEEVRGYVLRSDGSGWWLASADGAIEAVPFPDLPAPLRPRSPVDDGVDAPHHRAARDERLGASAPAAPGTVHVLRLALEADHRFYSNHNETWSEEMLEAFHLVEGIYLSQIDVAFNVTWIGAWEEPDPYTKYELCGRDGKLRQFRDHWEANRADVPRHNAYLTAGGALGSGCGFIRQIDSDWSYAVSYWYWGTTAYVPEGFTYHRMILQTHELGHNFGGLHGRSIGGCNYGTIMTSCYGATTPNFSPKRADGGQGNLLPMRDYAGQRLPTRPLV